MAYSDEDGPKTRRNKHHLWYTEGDDILPMLWATHAGGSPLESLEGARRVVDAAADKKASDIVLLDIHDLSIIADYFVICTGTNPRQIGAIASAVDDELGKAGANLLHREGNPESGWVLLDFGDIICHVFGPMEREYYQLERLWGAAQRLLYVE